MKGKKMKNVENNKGFSLVEILVAMAILSIIVIPLLHTFVTAANINSKSKQILRSSTIAQNILEETKAYSIDDIARKVNGYSIDEKGDPISVSLSSSETYEAACTLGADGKVSSCTAVTKSEDGGALTSSVKAYFDPNNTVMGSDGPIYQFDKTEFVGNANNEYFFVEQNISLESTSAKYDVLMRLKSTSTTDVANILSMNQKDCAYFVEDMDELSTVTKEFYDRYVIQLNGTTPVLQQSDFDDLISKKVEIDVKKDDADKVMVNVTYTYYCSNEVVTDNVYSTLTTTIFNNFVDNIDLNAVYIYYYPFYSTTSTKDTFTITNSTGDDVTVYLVSMVHPTKYSLVKEQSYRAGLNVFEDTLHTASSCDNTSILSNVITWDKLASITVGDLGNSASLNLKYDITVWVYKHNDVFDPTKDLVTTFTGSKLENN